MKTLSEIENEVAVSKGYADFEQMYRIDPESCIESCRRIAVLYAREIAEDVRQRCADNARLGQSILQTEIITP